MLGCNTSALGASVVVWATTNACWFTPQNALQQPFDITECLAEPEDRKEHGCLHSFLRKRQRKACEWLSQPGRKDGWASKEASPVSSAHINPLLDMRLLICWNATPWCILVLLVGGEPTKWGWESDLWQSCRVVHCSELGIRLLWIFSQKALI